MLVLPLLAALFLAFTPAAPSTPIQLSMYRGSLEYRAPTQSMWVPATRLKFAVPPGTQLRVPETAEIAWLGLPGGAAVRLQEPGTELALQSGSPAVMAGLAQFTEVGHSSIAFPGGMLHDLSGPHAAVQIFASDSPVAGLVEVYNNSNWTNRMAVSWNGAPAALPLGVDMVAILRPGEAPAVVKRPEQPAIRALEVGNAFKSRLQQGICGLPGPHGAVGPCVADSVPPPEPGPIVGALLPARCAQDRPCVVLVAIGQVFTVANPTVASQLLGHEITAGGTRHGNSLTLRDARPLCKGC